MLRVALEVPLAALGLGGLASLPFVVAPLAWSGRLAELKPVRAFPHLVRGLLGVVMLGTFVFALRGQSMADVYSIYMAAPLLIVMLAALLLGEQVDLGRRLAILVGLAGVIVILQPTGSGLGWFAGVAAVASALCYALGVIVARVMTRTERSSTMVFSFLSVVAVVCTALSLPGWVSIEAAHWPWIERAWALEQAPLAWLIAVRVGVHWAVTALPLLLLTPAFAQLLALPAVLLEPLMLALALGTPLLSLIGAVVAALTVGIRRSGILLAVLALPLYVPVLVFGAGAVMAAAQGLPWLGAIYLLAAGLVLALVLAPLAAATALRIALT